MTFKTILKEFFFNPLSIALVAVHLILLIYIVFVGGTPDPKFGIHSVSTLYTAISVLDLPALVLASGIISLSPGLANNWLTGTLIVVCTSIQWTLIGYLLWKLFRSRKIE